MAKTTKKEVSKPKSKAKNNKEKFYAAEEQGILPEETKEQIEEEMEEGEKETDVYSEEGRDVLEGEDEISPEEEGFMEGASGLGQLGKDALTGKPLMGDDIVELEFQGRRYRFNNQKNAEEFLKVKGKRQNVKKIEPVRKQKKK